MADNQNQSGRGRTKSPGRQAWQPATATPSTYIPDHKHGHEDRTGVGLTKTAINHCESRASEDPMRLTGENAYHMKTMVHSNPPSSQRSFPGTDTQPGGITYEFKGDVNGQPAGAYASDRGTGLRINTTYTPDDKKGFKKLN